MLSDIEIAQSCQMRPIAEVAAAAGLDADDLELYGKYKAKLSTDVWTKLEGHENGKLVLVTAPPPRARVRPPRPSASVKRWPSLARMR